ncbi:Reversal of tor2 lethality [Thecaphora frezii]
MLRTSLYVVVATVLGCLAVAIHAQDTADTTTDATAETSAADSTSTDTTTTDSTPVTYGLNNVTSLVGTWSSGSQAVETGLGFFNPIIQRFTLPSNAGISYSFTEDGFFETSKYRFESNAKTNRCFKATLIWQHGTYKMHPNGSITLHPFGPDGYVQVIDPCAATTTQIFHYNEFELISQWYNYIDGHPGFQPENPSAYAMAMYQSDGQKMPMMWLKYRPPKMLPTQQLFMQVLNS